MTDLTDMTVRIRIDGTEEGETVGQREARRQQAITELYRAYARCFGTPDGQVVLADILTQAFGDRPTIVRGANGVDPYYTLFNEGKRAHALDIQTRIQRGREADRTERQTKAVSSTAEEM